MDEFGFIAGYLAKLSGEEALDLKDDVAVWNPPVGMDAIFSMDTIVEGVHFPMGKFDGEVAQKLLRVNLSDLVAKGADPVGYMLSLSIPTGKSSDELAVFCSGLGDFQALFSLKLWGGDTTVTNGPGVYSATIVGIVPKGETVLRRGAKAGDILCVTGTIGDAYLGLKTALKQIDMDTFKPYIPIWSRAYHLPDPPYQLRHSIRELATASLDVSDGLIADACHLAKASQVRLNIELENIPLSGASKKWVDAQPDPINALISLATGGDDYQVLMCLPEAGVDELLSHAVALGTNLTPIGHVSKGEGVICTGSAGDIIDIETPGYTHF
jgi:thiamine-monophosphate kinase